MDEYSRQSKYISLTGVSKSQIRGEESEVKQKKKIQIKKDHRETKITFFDVNFTNAELWNVGDGMSMV